MKILSPRLLLAASLLAFTVSLSAQCELQRLWTITDLAPELARYWVDVERVDFNNDIAVFTRRERNDCKIMSCPPYDVIDDRLVFRYSLTDSLSVRIRERSCRRLEAYAEDGQNRQLFVLIASPDNQCDYAPNTSGCRTTGLGGRLRTDTLPRHPPPVPPTLCDLCPQCPECTNKPRPKPPEPPTTSKPECIFCEFTDPDSPVPLWLQWLFILLYVFYWLSFLGLWLMGRTRQRNYCWWFLVVISGLYSPFAAGPMLAFALHLSVAIAYFLRELNMLNSIGKLAFYGGFSALLVIYEQVIRFGLEAAAGPEFLYMSGVPLIAFIAGLRLVAGVVYDGLRLGFGGLFFYFVMICILYFGPYWYVLKSRVSIIEWIMGLGFF